MPAIEESAAPSRRLSLVDCTSIIVGIIIGSGIYRSTPDIAGAVTGVGMLVGVWILGWAIALIGSLSYAELASTYPHEGGDYVFLTRAYGSVCGFLFAWLEFWVIRPGSIGAMAFVFAQYAHELFPLADNAISSQLVYAVSSVGALSAVNVLGIRSGTWTQNVLTAVKVLGLLAIFLTACWFFLRSPSSPTPSPSPSTASEASDGAFNWGGFRFAMILVMFTYGGWNDISYVAAEVKRPERNVLRALLLGTTIVAVVYILVTIAFVMGLGLDGVRQSSAVAADLMRKPLGATGANAISLLICISALGAINGMTLTGARIYYAMGSDHRLFDFLGRWNERLGTPVRALVAQGIATIGLVLIVGTYSNGFERILIVGAPFFWLFLTMVGISLFVLRFRDADIPRVHRVVLFPVTPILFCLSTAFMCHASTTYAISMAGQAIRTAMDEGGLSPIAAAFSAYREGTWAVVATFVGVLVGVFTWWRDKR